MARGGRDSQIRFRLPKCREPLPNRRERRYLDLLCPTWTEEATGTARCGPAPRDLRKKVTEVKLLNVEQSTDGLLPRKCPGAVGPRPDFSHLQNI